MRLIYNNWFTTDITSMIKVLKKIVIEKINWMAGLKFVVASDKGLGFLHKITGGI